MPLNTNSPSQSKEQLLNSKVDGATVEWEHQHGKGQPDTKKPANLNIFGYRQRFKNNHANLNRFETQSKNRVS
jgi:hypothetical protein